MRRIQVRTDQATCELLRSQAIERGLSPSALLSQVLAEYLAPAGSEHHFETLTFVGSASSIQGKLKPVSERHDDALAEALHE